ncbi:uncharacterized protein C8A04DRAFT_30602 [Dichotomopilus funicola]|uniref:FAD binding domain-containing protein n=1 Tax=Dichotomopilus funicola TaxID=1934379 RepID=A0AAN6ZL07_9PEZI|nr:hypothetical protein C8A04DRAFT_30602 [Dichotomopilus funicola]
MAIPTTVDIVIIGAGPAGLALANWFRNSGITVLLIDKKPGPTQRGHAEGLKSTTTEILGSFGLGPQVEAEAWRLEEIAIWGVDGSEQDRADPDGGSESGWSQDGERKARGLRRERVMKDRVEELGFGTVRETILQQARVEYHMLQNLLGHDNIDVRYSTCPVSVDIDTFLGHHKEGYPVTVGLVSADGVDSAKAETIRAKYIVGCDGAHSWLRKKLGVEFEGDLTDSAWGVVDLIPRTNFPDIRRISYIRTPSTGTMMLMPRPHREVRIYVPLPSPPSDPAEPVPETTLEQILTAAQDRFHPYTLDLDLSPPPTNPSKTCCEKTIEEKNNISWWSTYRVGQRVGTSFSVANERAFLAGDAVHTHSPKAGQGMNTAIQDAYNLGWKLRMVLQGSPGKNCGGGSDKAETAVAGKLLRTYHLERKKVAEDVVAHDRGYLQLFTKPSSQPSSASQSFTPPFPTASESGKDEDQNQNEFQTSFLTAMQFSTGLSIQYAPSCVVQPSPLSSALDSPILKANLAPGKRLQDFQAIYHADGIVERIHNRLRATGQFRVVVFAGDVADPLVTRRSWELGRFLVDPDNGLGLLTVPKTTGKGKVAGKGEDSITWESVPVEVLMVHCGDRAEVELLDLHEVYRPWSRDSGVDYWRVLVDEEGGLGHGRVYERLEIDRKRGCCVVVRPDGYIGAVVEMGDSEGVRGYFRGLGML